MVVVQFYHNGGLPSGAIDAALSKIQTAAAAAALRVNSLTTELCFYVETTEKELTVEELERLAWVLQTSFQDGTFGKISTLSIEPSGMELLIEIGPRLNFSTAFSTNAVSICKSIGLKRLTRIEYSTRYLVRFDPTTQESGERIHILEQVKDVIVGVLHDKMTQCLYLKPITTFALDICPEPVYSVDVMGQGKAALEKANMDLGLAFDDWDLDYYTKLFQEKIKQNPTSVECFDLAQSNSEHSRHWFFKGRMVVDGIEEDHSLFQMVMNTQKSSNQNNIIKFTDNSSAISGHPVEVLYPEDPSKPGAFLLKSGVLRHVLFTAETHNFPTGVAPFPGATTGTGGRIRDVQATGRGAHVVAGTAGYCFGNLQIPGYQLPWEDVTFVYPSNFASPLEIVIDASNGASDYGNKFGEPVLAGFARSFGLRMPGGERREWVKPIMFTGGLGQLEDVHVNKGSPEKGMEIVKVGGPIYRIGVGGGAASSVQVQGDSELELDFGAVQRGDAEMEQKMNRVIRACIEMQGRNPIQSIHDQGAGGNGNVLKEICEPSGALIKAGQFQLGDPTISILELWGAEYQESNAILIHKEDHDVLQKIGEREKCPVSFVGTITGDGKICLEDDRYEISDGQANGREVTAEMRCPVNLDLEYVLGSMPRKEFHLQRVEPTLTPLCLPEDVTIRKALDRVLRLPSVASKRYLTNKVDRSVTGLVAQQQCVGPHHTPLADFALTALSHFDLVGSATAIGEQPIKGLINPGCGARMAVGEALTNLVLAKITDLQDVKCSGNWMWAAKLPGEGAALLDACHAMCEVMGKIGVAVDGGKDSLSMAARVGTETVKAPGSLVVSVYVTCPDITAKVTPDLKRPEGKGVLLYVPLSPGHHRLGGSALAQCYKQIGDVSPDLDDPSLFVKVFNVTQQLVEERLLTAGHDVSDGGLITCLLEMAFAGNSGINVVVPSGGKSKVLDVLFAEELGLVFEVSGGNQQKVVEAYSSVGVSCCVLGHSTGHGKDAEISIHYEGEEVLHESMISLWNIWEETSFQLEKLQANPICVCQEQQGLSQRGIPPYTLTFDPERLEVSSSLHNGIGSVQPCVAVIREEGSNGDREMVAAFHMAGFKVWDVNMQDLCSGSVTLDRFRGLAFVGGFSYADVCGSAKGWAAIAKFNGRVQAQFQEFFLRKGTFSLGVCNGCQLMALLGWVAPDNLENGVDFTQGLHVTNNLSERYESRFVTVKIQASPAVMLRGMEGSILGVWVAHGEGRMVFKNEATRQAVIEGSLVPLVYVDDDGFPTLQYPLNPNGTSGGIAALCSRDGRHLAMMPHPERCVLPWQWPWMPQEWQAKVKVSPWLCMFQNAYKWCQENIY